ncbi:MAG: 4-hydroxy-2-oxovalerate aldolase [Proteobacteria bacterium]|nr:4-hydroxy-2-oxovalerate aldolase [Pseudomonadota bacterium]
MTTKNESVQILETTLRDGSYAINFGFSVSDTALIARALEKAGFDLIEIGHGIGLGASEAGKGPAQATDEEYLAAAAEALSRAKFGMFCIPGIARLEDLDLAADYGMGFVRIGTNVTEVEQSEPFIARAKSRGMHVCANFMKSYAMPPAEVALKARLSQGFGADVIYIVDSAGGMLPSDLRVFWEAVREACDLPLAFHGHDNLGLAVANSLLAAELGAVYIDGSLQGLGRSAGNAPTEILLVALARMGFDLKIDPLEVMDIGERYVRPLMKRTGISSLDVVCGEAQFHSSYMHLIARYSGKYGVDPRKLIRAVCAVDKADAPAMLVEDKAREIRDAQQTVFSAWFQFQDYFGREQSGDD